MVFFKVGLRQLDMDLLCQLWSLNETLIEVKKTFEERRKESQIVDEEDEEGTNLTLSVIIPIHCSKSLFCRSRG